MAVPRGVVRNEPIAARLGVDEEWIVARTGVGERRILARGREPARSRGGCRRAGARPAPASRPAAVDQVLVATMSHGRLTPNLAPLVAERIGRAAPERWTWAPPAPASSRARAGGFAGRGGPGRERARGRRGSAEHPHRSGRQGHGRAVRGRRGGGLVGPPVVPASARSVLGSDGAGSRAGDRASATRRDPRCVARTPSARRSTGWRRRRSSAALGGARPRRDRPVRLSPGQRPDPPRPRLSDSGSSLSAWSSASRATGTPRRPRSRSRWRPRSEAGSSPATRCCSPRSAAAYLGRDGGRMGGLDA